MGQKHFQKQNIHFKNEVKQRVREGYRSSSNMTPKQNAVTHRSKASQLGHYSQFFGSQSFATFALGYNKKPLWCSKHAPDHTFYLFGKRAQQTKKKKPLSVKKIMKRKEKKEVIVNGFIFTTEDEVVNCSTLKGQEACIRALEDAFEESIGLENMLPKGIVS